MKISTSIALLCLASVAGAQTKATAVKAPGIPGNYPPPPGSMFVVAGGSDDCANAATNDSIVGVGTFAVTTTGATTGVTPQSSPTTVKNDVWFYWQATMNCSATLATCGGVAADSEIAVWADNNGGACPSGTQLAFNDDFCGLQSSITWSVTAGTHYFLQIGAFSAGTTYSGTFTVVESGTSCGCGSVAYCFGDGSGTSCPCANNGAAGNGCANSVNANGANLGSTGCPSISNDTFVLQGSGMPNAAARYFQGTARVAIPFGDGLRCAGGTVIKLGIKLNTAGASSYPVGADPLISVRGMNVAGNVRDYQCWYRNVAAFCTPPAFNLTNGLETTWTL